MADELVNGTAGADTLIITATGADSGSYSLNGGAAVAFTGATSFTFNGLGDNDILRIINPAGGLFGPTGGITYDGGGQAGDALEILGGVANFGSYTPGLTDLILHSGASNSQSIRFTGPISVTDTVTEASFSINGTAGADTITVTDGGLVGGQQAWTVASPTHASIRFANKTQTSVSGDSADTLSLDAANTAAGLTTLAIQGVGTVSQTQALTVANLIIINPENHVILTDANDVDTFRVQIADLGESVQFRDTDGFTVAGITTNGGAVTLATDAGGITIGTAAANTGIDTGVGNLVRLQATTGFVTQTANGAIVGGVLGALGIRAQDAVTLTAASNNVDRLAIVSTQGDVEYRDIGDVTIASISDAGALFPTRAVGISSGGNDINLQIGGNLLLDDGNAGTASIDAGAGDLRIVAIGTVSQDTANDQIRADELGIIAGAVSLTVGDNDVRNLAISTTGLVEFRDIDDLTLQTVVAGGTAGFTGVTGISSGNNDVNLQVFTDLILDADINAGTGDVRLFAGGVTNPLGGGVVADELGVIAVSGVEIEGAGADVNTLAILSAGAVTFDNSGALTIGTVAAGGNAGFGGATGILAGGAIGVSTASLLTVANDVNAISGDILLAAGDSSAAGDDLTLNGAAQITANAGNVVLRAGDNLILAGQVTANGGTGTVTGSIDFGNADAGTGGTATLTGSISASSRSVSGESDADSFLGGIGPDTFFGGAGDDTLTGGASDDALDGGVGVDTAVFSGNRSSYTLQVVGSNVMIDGLDGTDTLSSIERLQFADGTISLDDGNPLFDTPFYLTQNPDVFQAGVDALSHFNTHGFHEGRDPNAFFDTSGYLAVNSDVAAAGVNPLEHFHQSGWKEGRDPSAGFDTTLYLLSNPDVAAAGVDPLEHFLNHGIAEGRQAFTAIGQSIVNGFDFEFYLLNNPDVAAAGVNALTHFNSVGWTEGRNPNAWFDTAGYLSHYADVAAAGINPLQHYETHGWIEGRDPSAGFDTLGYLAANPDVAAANINPLDHFLKFGIYEGRAAVNDGVFF
jgi:hypothetical protein